MALPDPTKMAAVLRQLPDADIAAIDAVADVIEHQDFWLEDAVQEHLADACVEWPADAEVGTIEIAVAILRGASEAIARAKATASTGMTLEAFVSRGRAAQAAVDEATADGLESNSGGSP